MQLLPSIEPDRARSRALQTEPFQVIAATATALPEHRYSQEELTALAVRMMPGAEEHAGGIRRFFRQVGVTERYLALPLDEYEKLGGLERRSRAWIQVALRLAERVTRSLLDEAGLRAEDIGCLITTTVTGIAVPSLDARLMNVLPFSPYTKRIPLFGLGCLGGAAGIARAADYLRAFPEEAAILLSVELCSLTFQRDDGSIANVVSCGLFGDGASGVLLLGARHRLAMNAPAPARRVGSASLQGASPRVVASRSVFFPDTERVMGWDVIDTGFKVVLSPDVPAIVRAHVPAALDTFLTEHGVRRSDIATWILHPGGPKVIDALEDSLALVKGTLKPTRDGLAVFGNMSSSSVLFLLDEYRRRRAPPRGSYGVLMAMGPAFCAEMVLLRW